MPSQIQEAAEHSELVIFVGAGCSCLLGYPNWETYSDEVLSQISDGSVPVSLKKLNPRVKLSIAFEMARNNKKTVNYEKILPVKNDEDTSTKRKRLNNAFLKLANLFVTTNYDRELDSMFQRRGAKREFLDDNGRNVTEQSPAKIIRTPSECLFSSLSYKGNVVLHIHGSIDKPEAMVQTLRDYIYLYYVKTTEEVNSSRNEITYFLEQLFNSHITVLFLGYSLDEIEILEYILSKSKIITNNSDIQRFFILKGFNSELEKELARYLSIYYKNHCGVELIPFDNRDKDQLLDVIESFAARIKKRSNKLVNSRHFDCVLRNTSLHDREAEFARIMAESSCIEQLYGYERILEETNPECFFDHLNDNKLFSIDYIPHIEEVEANGEGLSYRSHVWPAQEYLIMVSRFRNHAKNIIKIILDISCYSIEHENGYSYSHIFAGFAEMYVNMPLKMLTMKTLGIVDIWLKIKARNALCINIIFKNLIPKLLKGNDQRNHRKACRLLKICTQLYWIKDKNIEGRKEAKTYVEGYWFKEHISKMAKLYGQKAGIIAAKIFLDRLTEASRSDRNGSLSIIWRPAIEDHPQNEHKNIIIGTLVVGLRDSLCGAIEKQREDTKLFLSKLLTDKSIIIRRVALSVIDSNWYLLKDMWDEVINAGLSEYYMRHETYVFLNNHFASFSKEQQSQLLAKLSDIEHDDTEDLERTQLIFLHAIYDKGSKDVGEWYRMLQSKHKYAITEHPDFIFYTGTRWLDGTERSPYSREDILSFLSDNRLIEKLNGFVPNVDDGWRSPTIGALAAMLEKIIEDNPIVFISCINEFKKANVAFQYAIIRAFYNLWNKNALNKLQWQRIWEEMMSLFISIIGNEEIWNDRDVDNDKFTLIPQKGWLLNSVIDFLRVGEENEERAYPEKFLSQGFYLINVFLKKMKRNEYCPETVEDINDVYGDAISSLNGKVFATLIYQLLRECRTANNESDKIAVIWDKYRQLFEDEFSPEYGPNYLFYNIFIYNAIDLYFYVDTTWTEEKLKIIFSETQDDKTFLCALDGLRYIRYTTDNFNLLKNTQIWKKSVGLTIPDSNVRETVYEWLGLAYLNGVEEINGPYLRKLYDNCDVEALTTITNLFYRENNNERSFEYLEDIIDFWRYTSMWLESTRPENASQLISELCTLFIDLERIDCENKDAFVFLMRQRQKGDFMTGFIWEEVSRLFDISENQDVIISTLLSMDLSNEIDYGNTIHNLIEKIGVKNRVEAREISEKRGDTELYLKLSQ